MIARGSVLFRFFIIASAVHACASANLQVPSSAWAISQVSKWILPYRGPECVVEVIRADIKARSSIGLDRWGKPDVRVQCRHKRFVRSTPIEVNNLKPQWYFSAKLPHVKNRGFCFTVYDADVFGSDECIGRCFINAKQANALMKSQKSKVLSIGDGIGTVEVRLRTVKACAVNYPAPKKSKMVQASSAAKPTHEFWGLGFGLSNQFRDFGGFAQASNVAKPKLGFGLSSQFRDVGGFAQASNAAKPKLSFGLSS